MKSKLLFFVILFSLLSTGVAHAASLTISKNYQLYDQGSAILSLQQYLNTNGFMLAESGPGSLGNETSFFGLLTYKALKLYQSAEGLPSTGYLGPLTRAKLAQPSVTTTTTTTISSTSTTTSTTTQATSASYTCPAGATCIPGTSIIQPITPGSGYVPGFGGGGGDTIPPVITLNGGNPLTVAQGSTFTDPGATATDNLDGTDSVSVSGSVNTAVIGTYTLTYSATDHAGNHASSVSRTVNVTDQTPPVLSAISAGSPGLTGVNSATITWTTNENSTSKVVYGTTLSYGSVGTSATLVTSHSINISGLTTNTAYHYAVVSSDASGNTATSSDQTFNSAVATLPSGAIGAWYIDQFVSSPRPVIANVISGVATSSNLFGAPRNLFANTEWWVISGGTTVVDGAATAPDGTSDASTITGTGNWFLHSVATNTLPAGTYTIAVNAKSNTGTNQQFAFYRANTGVRGPAQTATTIWQRFSWTFTLASPAAINLIGLGSIDGTTAGNLQIVDFELYSGSSDLGPESYGANLYLGSNAFDTKPSYANGALNLSTGGYGLIQFPNSQTLSTFTVQALVSKVGQGSGGYSSILSKVQDFNAFSAMTERASVPYSYFDGPSVGPAQSQGLWIATSTGYHTITLRYNGTNFDYWIDDLKILSTTTSLAPVSVADLFLNITNSTGLYGGNKFAGVIGLWNRALSDTEVRNGAALEQQQAASSSIAAPVTNRVLVAEGDSITGGFSFSYPYLFGPNASPALYGVDYAVSGSTIADLNARAATVDAIIPPNTNGRTFILSVLIGANDLHGGGDPTTFLNSLAAYLDARRAAGWKVIIATILPQTAPGENASRNTANAEIRLWTTGGSLVPGIHADAIADFAADPTMGCDNCAANTTYYLDGEHPTAAGQAILESIYAPVVNGM